MLRRDILEVIEEILVLLEREGELSISGISHQVRANRDTTRRAVEFLKLHGLVKEREGEKAFKRARMFSLKEA